MELATSYLCDQTKNHAIQLISIEAGITIKGQVYSLESRCCVNFRVLWEMVLAQVGLIHYWRLLQQVPPQQQAANPLFAKVCLFHA